MKFFNYIFIVLFTFTVSVPATTMALADCSDESVHNEIHGDMNETTGMSMATELSSSSDVEEVSGVSNETSDCPTCQCLHCVTIAEHEFNDNGFHKLSKIKLSKHSNLSKGYTRPEINPPRFIL